jgi:hypothetical protein
MGENEYCPSCNTKLTGIKDNMPQTNISPRSSGGKSSSINPVIPAIAIICLLIVAYFSSGLFFPKTDEHIQITPVPTVVQTRTIVTQSTSTETDFTTLPQSPSIIPTKMVEKGTRNGTIQYTASLPTPTLSVSQFSDVTHVGVSIMPCTGSGVGYGNIIRPDLRDINNISVKWSGVNLPVDIDIYTTKLDDNLNEIQDQLVYKETRTISSWQDNEIKVSFSSLHIPVSIKPACAIGYTYVTVHTPEGKIYSGKSTEENALTPESCPLENGNMTSCLFNLL